jgi:anti-sigma B factor antagonist
MKLNVRESENDVVVVTIDGNIMQEYVSVFRMRLDDLINNGKSRLVLDLKEVSYMSSMCLAIIIDMKNRTAALGGDLKIACANKLVANLLEITNLNRRLAVFESVELAGAAFHRD